MYRYFLLVCVMGSLSLVGPASAQELSTESPAPATVSEEAKAPGDPCAGITCSGHGNCVMVSGVPVCACDDGYQADPVTKVGCVPAVQAPPTYVVPLQPAPSTPPLTEADYQAAIQQRGTGLALMIPGIIFTAASVGLGIAALVLDDSERYCSAYDCFETKEASNPDLVTGLAIGSLASLGVGLGLLIPGIINRSRGGRIMRRYEAQQSQLQAKSPQVTPFVNLSARYQGGGVRLSF